MAHRQTEEITMQQWQHAQVRLTFKGDPLGGDAIVEARLPNEDWREDGYANPLEALNRLGTQGWRVVSSDAIGTPENYQRLYTLARPFR
jgi:hypothetical protein